MCLIALEALGSVYANTQIAVALFPPFEGAPVTIGRPHLSFEHPSEQLRYRDVFFSGLSSGPMCNVCIQRYRDVL